MPSKWSAGPLSEQLSPNSNAEHPTILYAFLTISLSDRPYLSLFIILFFSKLSLSSEDFSKEKKKKKISSSILTWFVGFLFSANGIGLSNVVFPMLVPM